MEKPQGETEKRIIQGMRSEERATFQTPTEKRNQLLEKFKKYLKFCVKYFTQSNAYHGWLLPSNKAILRHFLKFSCLGLQYHIPMLRITIECVFGEVGPKVPKVRPQASNFLLLENWTLWMYM